MLVIWTDCDREGEAIGSNIAKLCKKVNPSLKVMRARFSAVTSRFLLSFLYCRVDILVREMHNAMNNLTVLDENQAKAVETRQEIDLRTGAAFTRFLTITFKTKLSHDLKDKVLSYGSCQFPTLGFVVEQYLKVQNFKPEQFWKADLSVKKDLQVVPFNWIRGHLFDPFLATIFYEKMATNPSAVISSVKTTPTTQR